ncbi:MAG TPA: cupredoxin family copper-binding protein [Pararhizobium sp.]|uniref:cupredoxin domain-containing protein n=1 Tax=Pararhizobium sp. TaxID=1977563 RepID=UPI002BC8C6DE|nr:cupredoxin family copper-binding protein [Pararhizobium sp.]HTO30473.1 cupredoxin family copper-binding protein [Pararhizobium sp.]
MIMRTAMLGGVAMMLASLSAQAATVKVVIDKLVFTPAEISLAVGDTIEWVNRDVMEHTATVEGGFDVRIPAKKSASIVVKEAGTLDYYCRYHPNMRGRIVVQAK